MGESWLSVLLATTVTAMTMMACTTMAAAVAVEPSTTGPLSSTTVRDDSFDSKRVIFRLNVYIYHFVSPSVKLHYISLYRARPCVAVKVK